MLENQHLKQHVELMTARGVVSDSKVGVFQSLLQPTDGDGQGGRRHRLFAELCRYLDRDDNMRAQFIRDILLFTNRPVSSEPNDEKAERDIMFQLIVSRTESTTGSWWRSRLPLRGNRFLSGWRLIGHRLSWPRCSVTWVQRYQLGSRFCCYL